MTTHVRHRRRRPRSRDEMLSAVEARIERDRLDDATMALVREAFAAMPDEHRWGAHARPTPTRTLAGWLLRRVTRRPGVDYPKEQR